MIRDGFDYWRPKVVVVVVVSIHSYILKRFKGVWYVESLGGGETTTTMIRDGFVRLLEANNKAL